MTDNANHITAYFWLILIAFVVSLVTRRAKIPYALALVVTGLAIGIPHLLPQAHLDPYLLFTVFLPPLLFDSAINLRVVPLQREWKAITVYTLAGTVASTFIVGALTSWALSIPVPAGMVFGALISTTDPISVIAVFRRLGADRRLTLIMEAESLFNNDTAVVLFTVMMGVLAGGRPGYAASIWEFVRLVAGGALVGIACGWLASRVHHEVDDHLVEITLTTVVAFGSYLCAETLHVSGVMAVVSAGLVVGNYSMQSAMSPGTRLAVSAFWEYAAFVVNSIVFLLIGIEAAYVRWSDRLLLTLGAIGAVLLGRAAIYPISLLVNRVGGRVPRSWQHVLVWGGLRGALSMALVLGLDRRFPQRDALVAATFGVVVFSLLVQGATLGPLMRRLGLSVKPREMKAGKRLLASELVAARAALMELDKLRAHESHPGWAIELLAQGYRSRIKELEVAIEAAEPEFRARDDEQARNAYHLALEAEKSAFKEAERQGWLTQRDWEQISARLDTELVALLSHNGGPSHRVDSEEA